MDATPTIRVIEENGLARALIRETRILEKRARFQGMVLGVVAMGMAEMWYARRQSMTKK